MTVAVPRLVSCPPTTRYPWVRSSLLATTWPTLMVPSPSPESPDKLWIRTSPLLITNPSKVTEALSWSKMVRPLSFGYKSVPSAFFPSTIKVPLITASCVSSGESAKTAPAGKVYSKAAHRSAAFFPLPAWLFLVWLLANSDTTT